MRKGKNTLAIRVSAGTGPDRGLYPLLVAEAPASAFVPQPPGHDRPMDPKDVAEGAYDFGYIKNFSPDQNKQASSGVSMSIIVAPCRFSKAVSL
jgi:hypothetical protein